MARPGSSVVGWKLDRSCRTELLDRIPPRYEKVVADHVTLAAKVARDAPLPAPVRARAVGHVDDGRGVQALVVEVAGSTERPDGGTYHITWSLDKAKGRKAKESNDVIARLGWTMLDLPMPVRLVPSRWP